MLIVGIIYLEQRKDSLASPNEIWMVGVDMRILDLNQAYNHV